MAFIVCEVTGKADRLERFDDGRCLGMTEADRLSVAVSEVHVTDVRTTGAKGRGVGDLLDVHVKEVTEELHIRNLARLKKVRSI